MDISDGLADLQEPFVLLDGHLEFTQVVVEDSSGVVGSTLVSRFTGSLASKGQYVVVFKSLLSCYSIV